jgi:hypothetical protein
MALKAKVMFYFLTWESHNIRICNIQQGAILNKHSRIGKGLNSWAKTLPFH